MTKKNKDEGFVTVAYDLPSEYRGICIEKDDDDEPTKKKKAKLRTEISHLRHKVRETLLLYGRFVNNSVFVIPRRSVKDVETFIAEVRKEYDSLNDRLSDEYGLTFDYDITTISFGASENERLRLKAKQVLIQELSKKCDDLDERINNLAQKGRGTTEKSIKTAHKKLAETENLLKNFDLSGDEQISDLFKQVSIKISDLAELAPTKDNEEG